MSLGAQSVLSPSRVFTTGGASTPSRTRSALSSFGSSVKTGSIQVDIWVWSSAGLIVEGRESLGTENFSKEGHLKSAGGSLATFFYTPASER